MKRHGLGSCRVPRSVLVARVGRGREPLRHPGLRLPRGPLYSRVGGRFGEQRQRSDARGSVNREMPSRSLRSYASTPKPTSPGPPQGARHRTRKPSDLRRCRDQRVLLGVELTGLEPVTPTLPVWCATSCATAPCDDYTLHDADLPHAQGAGTSVLPPRPGPAR